MVSVEGILKEATDNEQKAQQLVSVDKPIDLTYDLAHLAAFDSNPLDSQALKSDNREEYIKALTRDNTQLLVNKIWNLETKRVDNVITAVLPAPIYHLPRAKPIPKPKPPTKWELFAKSKGIIKKKKERMVWDEVTQQWKPRFGYRSISQQKDENQWMIEVPDQVTDPNVDFFAKQSEEKSERVAKNELQRLRNISRSQKLRLPGTSGILPNVDLKKDELLKAKSLAKKSTASLGKFLKIDSKDIAKDEKVPGVRRKFESNFSKDLNEEKQKNLQLMEKILSGQKRKEMDENYIERKVDKTLKRMNSRIKEVTNERRAAAAEKLNNNKDGKSSADGNGKKKIKKGGKSMKKYKNKLKNRK